MPLFKYGSRLFSTETIATVDDLKSRIAGRQDKITVHFNSGDKAPITIGGTLDEFLEASRTCSTPEDHAALREEFTGSGLVGTPKP